MEMASIILITVPHAIQTIASGDETAVRAAKILKQSLQKVAKNIVLYAFIGDEARDICDLNRIECRAKPFRRRIRNTLNMIQTTTTDPALLFDIHSFPAEAFNSLEIYFLSEQGHSQQQWVIELARFLSQKGVTLAAKPGGSNDVITEAIHKFGAFATLIEFNDMLEFERVQTICTWIAHWVQQWFFSHLSANARCNLM